MQTSANCGKGWSSTLNRQTRQTTAKIRTRVERFDSARNNRIHRRKRRRKHISRVFRKRNHSSSHAHGDKPINNAGSSSWLNTIRRLYTISKTNYRNTKSEAISRTLRIKLPITHGYGRKPAPLPANAISADNGA